MQDSEKIALGNFKQTFPPNPHKHGVLNALRTDAVGSPVKVVATYEGRVTDVILLEHLKRTTEVGRLGYLAGDEQGTTCGCIDVDLRHYNTTAEFNLVVKDICEEFANLQLPYYLEQSTSGGMHIWTFFDGAVDWITTRTFFSSLLRGARQPLLETYPRGSSGVDSTWIMQPYSGALIDSKGLGRTWLKQPDFTFLRESRDTLPEPGDIRVQDLHSLLRVSAFEVEAIAQDFNERNAKSLEEPREAVRFLKENMILLRRCAEKPPKLGFNRHETIAAFLNLGARCESLREMSEHLSSEQVFRAWITDGSRTYKAWKKEIQRWTKKIEDNPELGTGYGIKYLLDNGWKLGNLARVEVAVKEKEVSQKQPNGRLGELTATEWAELYAEHCSIEGRSIIYLPSSSELKEYQEGIYVVRSDHDVESDMARWIRVTNNTTFNENKLRETLVKLKRDHWARPEAEYEELGWIAVRNGHLRYSDMTLHDPSPNRVMFNRVDADYEPELEGERGLWHKFIDSSLPPELGRNGVYQTVLLEFMGYCLTPETRMQKFLNLVGQGGTGKSTVLRLMKGILGHKAAEVDVNILVTPSLREPLRAGTTAALVSEMPLYGSKIDEVMQVIKQITGQDPISHNPKFLRGFTQKSTAKLIIASNHNLRFGADSYNNSMDRRLLPITFNTPPKDTWDVAHQILEADDNDRERSILLLEMLSGLQRVMFNGWKFTDELRQEVTMRKASVNDVVQYIIASFDSSKTGLVRYRDLYDGYNTWRIINGEKSTNNKGFSTKMADAVFTLNQMGWEVSEARLRTSTGKVVEGFKGMEAKL